jgi:hypothetical protein
LHINDLECNFTFAVCNPNCIEPTNFAFIQTNGVPAGPPSPQLADLSSFTPNGQTLLMNPGDTVQAHIFDADLGGGQHALETQLTDLTTGQSGFMIASAANGFMATSHVDCSGTPFNYEPEFSTASPQNAVSWAALQVNVATQFEIGHFTPCTNVSQPRVVNLGGGVTDTIWNSCTGPYETTTAPDNSHNEEPSDSPCFPAGETDGGISPPNLVTGCVNSAVVNGDLDFDGTPYWPDWPNQTTPDSFPSTFPQQQPTSSRSHTPRFSSRQTRRPASQRASPPAPAARCRRRGPWATSTRTGPWPASARVPVGVRQDGQRQLVRRHRAVRVAVGVVLRHAGRAGHDVPRLFLSRRFRRSGAGQPDRCPATP